MLFLELCFILYFLKVRFCLLEMVIISRVLETKDEAKNCTTLKRRKTHFWALPYRDRREGVTAQISARFAK